MKHVRFEDTGARGWFIGSFPEAAVQTDLAEVCYTPEPVGPIKAHYHTRCTETLLIISGSVIIQDTKFVAGDVIVLYPGEVNDSVYLEPSMVIGVKTPAGADDKVYV
jgi:mannose-6-phosphate isomerase-like protein (cupin superfamily)